MRKEIIRIPTHPAKCLLATAKHSAFGVCVGKNMVDVKLLLRARHESTRVYMARQTRPNTGTTKKTQHVLSLRVPVSLKDPLHSWAE